MSHSGCVLHALLLSLLPCMLLLAVPCSRHISSTDSVGYVSLVPRNSKPLCDVHGNTLGVLGCSTSIIARVWTQATDTSIGTEACYAHSNAVNGACKACNVANAASYNTHIQPTDLVHCLLCLQERAVSLPGDGASAGAAAALMSSGSVPTPATAAADPAGRSHSLSEVELLQALPASLPASQDAPSSVRQQAQQQQQLRCRAASLDSARDPAAADRSPHPSSLQQQQNCGNPLKGLFACQCAAPAGVDKPVQQVPS